MDWDDLARRWAHPTAVWRVTPGPEARRAGDALFVPCADPIQGVAWSHDGRWVAVAGGGRIAGASGVVRVLEVATGRTLLLRGHGRGCHDVAFDPRTGWLATAGHDGFVGLWDLGAARAVAMRWGLPPHRLVFATERPWLAVADEVPGEAVRARVTVRDLAGDDDVLCWTFPERTYPSALAASPDGQHLWVLALKLDLSEQRLLVLEVASGRVVAEVVLDAGSLTHRLLWTPHGVLRSESVDGVRRVALHALDSAAQVASRDTGAHHMGGIAACGDRAVSVGSDDRMTVLRLPGLDVRGVVSQRGAHSMAVALAPDGSAVAVGGADGEGLGVWPVSLP